VRLTTAASLEEFRKVLDGRVEALARAQTSLAARRWEGASLYDVVTGELRGLAEPDRYEIRGAQVLLPPEHVQAMSMALHELATNAAKYGAFSTHEGRLSVSWRVQGDVLRLGWAETAGRRIEPPTHEGFGSRLIDQLARQLEGEVRFDWRPEGLAVELTGRLAQA
jgi:two-component sensor histidine kinase